MPSCLGKCSSSFRISQISPLLRRPSLNSPVWAACTGWLPCKNHVNIYSITFTTLLCTYLFIFCASCVSAFLEDVDSIISDMFPWYLAKCLGNDEERKKGNDSSVSSHCTVIYWCLVVWTVLTGNSLSAYRGRHILEMCLFELMITNWEHNLPTLWKI